MLKRLLPVSISALNADEVEVVMSTGALARDGHILVPQGAILDSYRANPVVLFQHDANVPVARASDIRVTGDTIVATITFAPLGVSAKADEIRGLVKSGIINAVSVGFDPQDGEPLDPKRPRGGMRYTVWELLECSFVSVPADTGAVVTAREHERDEMTEAANVRDNAATITAVQTGILTPNEARQAEGLPALAADKPTRAAILTRGLYEVSDLACLLANAGYLQSWVEMEAEWEGDGSDIPARFGACLKDLGQVLIDMTAEEVAELFADEAGERAIQILRRAKTRAGKRLSKATIASIEEAITHHDNGVRCMRDILDRDDDGGDDEMAHQPASTRATEPPLDEVGAARAASRERLQQLRRAGAVAARA
jgi:HK97 family phage prohead protease